MRWPTEWALERAAALWPRVSSSLEQAAVWRCLPAIRYACGSHAARTIILTRQSLRGSRSLAPAPWRREAAREAAGRAAHAHGPAASRRT